MDNSLAIEEATESSGKMKDALKKMKVALNFNKKRNVRKKFTETTLDIFGENADIQQLANSIISLYIPEEMTKKEEEEEHIKGQLSIKKLKSQPKSSFSFRNLTTAQDYKPKLERYASFNPKKAFNKDYLVASSNDSVILGDWSFDITKITNPHEKNRIIWVILNDLGLITEFKIDLEVLCRFITKLKEKYDKKDNPFHNFDHGVSVMHATHYLMKRTYTFDPLVHLGLIVAALCHDVAHTGRTNAYEIAKLTKLAIRYHDKSVLEQHHAATTFKILDDKKYNIFANIKGEEFRKLRKNMISNILATDMKEHVELMKNFKDLKNRMGEAANVEEFGWSQDDIRLFTGMLLHCADLSGPVKNFPIALSWAIKINTEFTNQLRDEERFGLPVTPYFRNLDKMHVMAKEEITFVSFMIKPLWETFNEFTMGACKLQLENLERNLQEWQKLKEQAEADLQANNAGANGEKAQADPSGNNSAPVQNEKKEELKENK